MVQHKIYDSDRDRLRAWRERKRREKEEAIAREQKLEQLRLEQLAMDFHNALLVIKDLIIHNTPGHLHRNMLAVVDLAAQQPAEEWDTLRQRHGEKQVSATVGVMQHENGLGL